MPFKYIHLILKLSYFELKRLLQSVDRFIARLSTHRWFILSLHAILWVSWNLFTIGKSRHKMFHWQLARTEYIFVNSVEVAVRMKTMKLILRWESTTMESRENAICNKNNVQKYQCFNTLGQNNAVCVGGLNHLIVVLIFLLGDITTCCLFGVKHLTRNNAHVLWTRHKEIILKAKSNCKIFVKNVYSKLSSAKRELNYRTHHTGESVLRTCCKKLLTYFMDISTLTPLWYM